MQPHSRSARHAMVVRLRNCSWPVLLQEGPDHPLHWLYDQIPETPVHGSRVVSAQRQVQKRGGGRGRELERGYCGERMSGNHVDGSTTSTSGVRKVRLSTGLRYRAQCYWSHLTDSYLREIHVCWHRRTQFVHAVHSRSLPHMSTTNSPQHIPLGLQGKHLGSVIQAPSRSSSSSSSRASTGAPAAAARGRPEMRRMAVCGRIGAPSRCRCYTTRRYWAVPGTAIGLLLK